MDRETAFTAMVEDNRGALVRLARRYSGPDDWQDLLQDMQLQLWRSFDAFDGRSQRSTWLYRVALNTALSHVRKPRRDHRPLDEAPEPADTGHAHDTVAVLDDFLAMLDPLQRSVLLLDLEGLPRAQVAEVLGLSANAVAVLTLASDGVTTISLLYLAAVLVLYLGLAWLNRRVARTQFRAHADALQRQIEGLDAGEA